MEPLTLETLKLEQIPGLTDGEIDQLYAELAEERGDIVTRILPDGVPGPRRFKPVCSPDCPASVIERLPTLVQEWTGQEVAITPLILANGSLSAQAVRWDALHASDVITSTCPYRHLAHACLCAALAACVVLGKATQQGD